MSKRALPWIVAVVAATIAIFALGTLPGAAATSGEILWTARYEGRAGGDDKAIGIVVSPDGSTVFVAGSSEGKSTGRDYAALAYDAATGERRWATRFNARASGDDWARSIALSPDGSALFVTGTSAGANGNDFATIALDPTTGSRVWVRRYDGPVSSNDEVSGLVVSPDSSVVLVAGSASKEAGGYGFVTIAYEAASGAVLWEAPWNGPADGSSYSVYASGLAASPDGTTVFVTGTGGATIALDVADGTLQWELLEDGGPCGVWPWSVVATDELVFVAGYEFCDIGDFPSSLDWTHAYDTQTGSKIWSYHTPFLVTNRTYGARALAVSPNAAEVVQTGDITGVRDYVTIKFQASTGTRAWIARYAGGRRDLGRDVAFTPDGSEIVVTGWSDGLRGNKPDFATIVYDAANGSQIWASRYDGPANGNDYAFALALSPDGTKVFVTGASAGADGYDFAVVAYSA